MRIRVTIEGLTSLLMNRFTETSEVAGPTGAPGARATFKGQQGTPREQAEPKAYRDADTGELFIPGPNIYAAIIAAGIFHKVGKRQVSTSVSSLVPAGIFVVELVCSLGTKQWEVDSRSVVNPSTRGRIMCYRPRVDKWRLSFTLDVDTSVFDPRLVRALVDDAGKKIGLGDFRPAKKGPFGRFVVVRWEEQKEPAAAA